MRGKKEGYVNIPFLFLVAATLLLIVITHTYVALTVPNSSVDKLHLVNIENGTSVRHTSKMLAQRGLIPSAWLFSFTSTLRGGKIMAGEYQLNSKFSPLQVLEILEQGKVYLHKITIPEGYTLRQIALLLQINNIIKAEEFLEAAKDVSLSTQLLGAGATGFEGYLFPETYHFARNAPAKYIIKAMANHFKEIFNEELKTKAAESGFTQHQIVTLASLIEKETAIDTERPLIASVYHNRLKKGIRLQCDPTVIYALEQSGRFDGNIRREDLELNSKYNTYRYSGLPPGPIANPGEASIMAALYPAETNYIYFVSRNDGTHKFSKSLEEHNQAVYKYQKRLKRNRIN